MDRRAVDAVLSDDDDEQRSPTPHASFILLEARDSHADDISTDSATAAPSNAQTGGTRSRASSSTYTPETHRHPFQFHTQHSHPNQRRPVPAALTRQPPPPPPNALPTPESYYEYGARMPAAASSPRTASSGTAGAVGNNSFQLRQQQQLARVARMDSLHDLFPMINSSVFTNPDNIMPSMQDTIVIDDGHDTVTSFQSTATGVTSTTINAHTLTQHSLAANQLSLNAIFGARTGAPSVGRAATASARDPSCQSFADLGLRGSSTSGDSLSDTLHTNASFVHRMSPKQWLRSLVQRFHTNWDSYFLLFTLVLSLAAVPVAIAIAAVLEARVPDDGYYAHCQLPVAKGDDHFRVSTASMATITIPVLNHAVLLVISTWIAIRCSRSRKRVLRSHATQSARLNLSTFLCLSVGVSVVTCCYLYGFIGLLLFSPSS